MILNNVGLSNISMIIYGWGHFNRRNYSIIRKDCEACGQYGYHQSYESSRFFTLYFIPLIPLGGEKVVSECPHCKAAQSLSKRQWKKLRNKDLPAVIEAYEADTSNREAAKSALVLAAQAHSKDSLRRLAPQIRSNFPNDAEIITLVATVFSYLCMDAEANEAYLVALEVDPSKEITQQSDLHMRAQDQIKPKPKNRLLQSLPVMIVPLILLYFFISFLSDSLRAHVDDACIINGLNVPYQVLVNGKKYSLQANGMIWIDNVGFGLNRIQPLEKDIKEVEFILDVPWYQRAYNAPAIIINPDQTAVILDESSEYTTTNDGHYSYNLGVGKGFYIYGDVDYFFTNYPEEIDLPTASSRVLKRRVSSLEDYSDVELVQTLLSEESEDTVSFIESKLRLDPNATELLPFGRALMPADDFLEVVRTKIDTDPVQIEWHRYYQNTLEDTQPDYKLLDEYQARLRAKPNNSALIYLLGRVTPDYDLAIDLFEKAYATQQSNGFAANALAYHYLLQGEMVIARNYSLEAIKRQPDALGFESTLQSILTACHDYKRLSELSAQEFAEYPYSMNAAYLQLAAAYMQSPDSSLDTIINDFCSKLKANNVYPDDQIEVSRAAMRGYAAALKGDVSSYLETLKVVSTDSSNFEKAILEERFADALKTLQASKENRYGYSDLILYILAEHKGKPALAQEALDSALALFKEGKKEQRQWFEWLTQNEAPELTALSYECLDPDQHYIVLTAFAQRFPESSELFMEHARKIKYSSNFSSLALNNLFAAR